MGLYPSILISGMHYIQSTDSVTALIFDKSGLWKKLICRINKEFVFVQQFRPALLFGASQLSKETIKNPNLGYWFVFHIFIIIQL